MITPRNYQEWAVQGLWNFVHERPTENPLVLMPTGTGKSFTMAMFVWLMLSHYPHLRFMNLTHVKELIEGNYNSLLKLWPSAPAGVYSAGLGSKNSNAQITYAGIQSAANKAELFGKIDFIIIDECQLVSEKGNAQYNKFIGNLRAVNPNLIVIGFTATGFRMGLGPLTEGDLFDDVAYDLSNGEAFVWMIENGYLSRLLPRRPDFELNSDAVGLVGGDFNNAQASDAMHQQDILERAVDYSIEVGVEEGRKAWLCFNQSIADAELVADMFTYKGYKFEAVHSKRNDRDEVLKCFREGGLWGVTNQDILTTGYDQANIDLIIGLRLTRSVPLWVQMMGRGTRPLYAEGFDLTTLEGRLHAILASDKQNCRALDFCGNTSRLGPINYPNMPARRGKGGGGSMTRDCPKCAAVLHLSITVCPDCGYKFPPPERVQANASSDEIISDGLSIDLTKPPVEKEIGVYDVHEMMAVHNTGRNGKLDTMKVSYRSGHKPYNVWVCFEHPKGSFPRRKAQEWWSMHGGVGEAPESVSTALSLVTDLQKPKFIKVWTNTKFPSVEGYDFEGTKFAMDLSGNAAKHEPSADPLAAIREIEEQERVEEERHLTAYRESLAMEGYTDDDIPF